jgi:hypothetical protein
LTLALGLLIGAASAGASGPKIVVKPANGTRTSAFSVRFTAPDSAGRDGARMREYLISSARPNAPRGCVSEASKVVTQARAHARVHVTLRPSGGKWCKGTFRGMIEEFERPICPPRQACPQYVLIVRTIGHFRYSVHG